MTALARVELQAEVGRGRDQLFELVSTSDGLHRWLDEAHIDAVVGGDVRFRLGTTEAIGSVLSMTPPQHISFSWDWEGEPLGAPSVVAFDLVDHGARSHLTLRHVGLDPLRDVQPHEILWQHWFGRLVVAATEDPTSLGQEGP